LSTSTTTSTDEARFNIDNYFSNFSLSG